jgi:hypothetical protein
LHGNTTQITGQGFTHQYLWNCATTLLTQPETKSPKDMHFAMAGMVMAYFTFEAYLNFVEVASNQPTGSMKEISLANDRIEELRGNSSFCARNIKLN